MNIDALLAFLGWNALINLVFFFFWLGMIIFARSWMYNMHGKWWNIKEEQFNAIHYAMIIIYKITIWVIFIIPYLVLRLAM